MENRFWLAWTKLLLLLLALWFIMSGIFETKFIIFGVASCLLIALSCLKVLKINACRTDKVYIIMSTDIFRVLSYMGWLIKELVKAALYVARVVTFERGKLNPQIVWFKADYDNPIARVVLANSITLTPGTITIDIMDNGVYAVHALTDELAQGVLDGSMQQMVARAYGEEIDFKALKASNRKQGNNIPVPTIRKKTFRGRRKAL
ncbi:MAG: Na+/H+ antiporter subunit E [Parasporobacterium sp.]|nr:Na+/H+ antiporter subunit E [Parasporobacterium sp.]